MGLTSQVTVVATLGTGTFWIAKSGGATGTLQTTGGQYIPSGFRIANVGTVAVFIQFGPAGQESTVALGTGMPLFPNTVETFCTKGQNAMAHISAGTATLYVTPGEGL